MKIPPLWICLLVIVILLALIVYVATHRKGVKESVSQFSNSEPKSLFIKLVAEFGAPQIVINQKGGFAMWFPSKVYENSPYESIILKDESETQSNDGTTKKNFVYTTIIIDIPEYKMNNIFTISKNVYYDRGSKEFTVRSGNMIMNKHILLAVMKYLTDPSVTIQKASDFLEQSWSENLLNNTPFSGTIFGDQIDDDIMAMINLNLPMGSPRINRELMMLE